jgi:hypothetical protein
MTLTWYDFVGFIGVGLVLAAYLALQLKWLPADSLKYSLANGVGAALILVSLYYDFNLSAAIIEAAWLAISLWGVFQYFARHKQIN